VWGDFDLGISDIDLLVATKNDIDELDDGFIELTYERSVLDFTHACRELRFWDRQ